MVGNDGSEFARDALRKGLWLASQLGAPVRVLRAWAISTAPRPATWAVGYVPPAEDFAAAVLQRLEGDTAEARAARPEVEVSLEARTGSRAANCCAPRPRPR